MKSTIYIVIPVHNKVDLTLKCLASLQQQTYPYYKVIVIDDGSSDGTYEKITAEYPAVTVLKGDGNLWWTGGTNMGIEHALLEAKEEDFVLTLNNDLEVYNDYLESLMEAYLINQPCLVGSTSVHNNEPDKIDFLGIKWNPYTAKSRPTLFISSYAELIKSEKFITSDALPGRGTLIPIDVFNKIGLFDQKNFPQYLADFDFSRRALYNGYKLIVSTEAVVKSVVENTGLSYKLSPSWKIFTQSLTSIKSPNRLKTKYLYGVIHSPIKHLYIIVSFLRIFFSFLREKYAN
jgi:GT2 family glycosyltransferase